MLLREIALLLAVAVLLGGALGTVAWAKLPPLIPREVLFGNPRRDSPAISPDGARLSYLAPSPQGVLNVWVRTLGRQDDEMITHDTHRGIRFYAWAYDGKHLLYIQDIAGDENWHVYVVDLATRETRDLTPYEGMRAQNLILNRHHPNELLVGLNRRDRSVFDMHRIELSTGEVSVDTQNPGDIVGWMTDPDFRIRAAVAQNPADGSTTLRVRDAADRPWRDLITWPFGEEGYPIDFTSDGRGLYVTSSIGSDTTRLVEVDAATGVERRTLAANPRADVGAVMVHPETHRVEAVSFDYLSAEWQVLDDSVRQDFEALAKVHRGDFSVLSRDRADTAWIVAYDVDDGPARYYVFRRPARRAELLFVNRPELEQYRLAPMKAVVIRVRDGLQLPAYLTVPVGVEPKGLPMVLDVHGGPWARDTWGYNPEAQWFANRGYAVLQVNFRGSTGFGKKFLNAGNRQWGADMQNDLTDAVRWAIAEGIADGKRVCIYGGSYGGYATLAGMTFTPELYACGVDIVGPSNVKTLLQSIPPYWAPIKKMFDLRVGEVQRDEDLNRKISPLFHVQNIGAPLLIAQGANDPRVNVRESDQIVEAMRAKGLPVTYVVYADEGHGFARPANRLDFYGRTDEFLARHLGGRAEPHRPVPGSSAELR